MARYASAAQARVNTRFWYGRRALETTDWRIKGPKGAATVLGLNPATLYSRMKKLGIRPGRQEERSRP